MTKLLVAILLLFVVLLSFTTRVDGKSPDFSRDKIFNSFSLPLQTPQRVRSATCQVNTIGCSSTGQFCGSNDTYSGICANANDVCNATSNTCITSPFTIATGSTCNQTAPPYCEAAYSICINSVCNSQGLPGSPCSHDYECLYSSFDSDTYIASCSNGKCAGLQQGAQCSEASSYCVLPLICGPLATCIQPQSAGATCHQDADCTQTLLCINEICTAQGRQGDPCNVTDNNCLEPFDCYPSSAGSSTGTCKAYYLGGLGDICSDSSNCGDGLTCNLTKCISGIPYSSSSKKQCDVDSDCAYYEECSCDTTGPAVCLVNGDFFANPSGIQKTSSDYLNCLYQCERTDYACIANNCGKIVCDTLAFITSTDVDQLKEFGGYPQCYLDELVNFYYANANEGFAGYIYCTPPSAASSIQVYFGFLALLLAATLLAM